MIEATSFVFCRPIYEFNFTFISKFIYENVVVYLFKLVSHVLCYTIFSFLFLILLGK